MARSHPTGCGNWQRCWGWMGLDGAGAGLMLAISKINGDINGVITISYGPLYHFDSGNFGQILSGNDSCDPPVARVYGNLVNVHKLGYPTPRLIISLN